MKILRAGYSWEKEGGNQKDRDYILWEARRLFRQNMNILETENIDKKLTEAEQRYELGWNRATEFSLPPSLPLSLVPFSMISLGNDS